MGTPAASRRSIPLEPVGGESRRRAEEDPSGRLVSLREQLVELEKMTPLLEFPDAPGRLRTLLDELRDLCGSLGFTHSEE